MYKPQLVLVAAFAALIVACGTEKIETSTESARILTAPTDYAGRGVPAPALIPRRAAVVAEMSAETPPLPPPQAVASNMIIRNGFVSVQVDSIEPAIERLRALATRYNGMVGSMNISAGEHQVRSATLVIKIPATNFDSAMVGMPTLGRVEQSNVSAEDVGEEFVDVSARMANAKRLEARLTSLLSTRTGKLEDVLAVERELARVRLEIERHEGRIRFLSTRVATSTINATVHEKAPIIAARPGDNVFLRALINMWRNFVTFLTFGIEALGVVIPLAAIGVAGFLAWRRWRPRVKPTDPSLRSG